MVLPLQKCCYNGCGKSCVDVVADPGAETIADYDENGYGGGYYERDQQWQTRPPPPRQTRPPPPRQTRPPPPRQTRPPPPQQTRPIADPNAPRIEVPLILSDSRAVDLERDP